MATACNRDELSVIETGSHMAMHRGEHCLSMLLEDGIVDKYSPEALHTRAYFLVVQQATQSILEGLHVATKPPHA